MKFLQIFDSDKKLIFYVILNDEKKLFSRISLI
jgi:hypothetical protein